MGAGHAGGLAPDRTYRVNWPERFGPVQRLRGKVLLEEGLMVHFPQRNSSAIVTIEPVEDD